MLKQRLRILLIFAVLLMAHPASCNEQFVRESDCTWTRPPKCGSKQKSSYKIDLHVMTGDDRDVHKNDDGAIADAGFPRELKQSARMAANLWLRAIRGRPARAIKIDLPKGCGSNSNSTRVGDLAICLKLDDFGGDELLAEAKTWGAARSDKLPRVVIVTVNSRAAGKYDRCDWNNIFMHELGHALGFGRDTFLQRGLYRESHDKSTAVFLGVNAKREWEAMGGSNGTDRYPLLRANDGSHWPEECFDSHELMQPFHRPSYHVYSGNARSTLLPLTLAVFQDLSYDVDFDCADERVALRSTSRCLYGGSGPPNKARRSWRKKRARSKKLKQFMQILRYVLGMEITWLRKQCRHIRVRLRRARKKIKQRWIPHAKKTCRKVYRRARRKLKTSIRGALPSLCWEHNYCGVYSCS